MRVATVTKVTRGPCVDVYDIEISNYHNFFAGRINVHNSADPKHCVLGS